MQTNVVFQSELTQLLDGVHNTKRILWKTMQDKGDCFTTMIAIVNGLLLKYIHKCIKNFLPTFSCNESNEMFLFRMLAHYPYAFLPGDRSPPGRWYSCQWPFAWPSRLLAESRDPREFCVAVHKHTHIYNAFRREGITRSD